MDVNEPTFLNGWKSVQGIPLPDDLVFKEAPIDVSFLESWISDWESSRDCSRGFALVVPAELFDQAHWAIHQVTADRPALQVQPIVAENPVMGRNEWSLRTRDFFPKGPDQFV